VVELALLRVRRTLNDAVDYACKNQWHYRHAACRTIMPVSRSIVACFVLHVVCCISSAARCMCSAHELCGERLACAHDLAALDTGKQRRESAEKNKACVRTAQAGTTSATAQCRCERRNAARQPSEPCRSRPRAHSHVAGARGDS
jgi:hypothetical protein